MDEMLLLEPKSAKKSIAGTKKRSKVGIVERTAHVLSTKKAFDGRFECALVVMLDSSYLSCYSFPAMKKDIHPTYYTDATVTCACGNTFTTGSTVKELRVEICSQCHPLYTGKQKFVDTARRVDRFKRLVEKKSEIKNRKTKSAKKAPAEA